MSDFVGPDATAAASAAAATPPATPAAAATDVGSPEGRPRRTAAERANVGFQNLGVRANKEKKKEKAGTKGKKKKKRSANTRTSRATGSRPNQPRAEPVNEDGPEPDDIEVTEGENDASEASDDGEDIVFDASQHQVSSSSSESDSDSNSDSSSSSSSDDSDSSVEVVTKKQAKKDKTEKDAKTEVAGKKIVTEKTPRLSRKIRKAALRVIKDAFPKACRSKYANLQTFCTITKPQGWVYLVLQKKWKRKHIDRAPRAIKRTLARFSRGLSVETLELFLSRFRMVCESTLMYVQSASSSSKGREMLGEQLLTLIEFSSYEAKQVRKVLIANRFSQGIALAADELDVFESMQLPSSLRSAVTSLDAKNGGRRNAQGRK